MRYLGLPFSVTWIKGLHSCPLKIKIACKLVLWVAKHVAAPGRAVLVKAALTAIAIYLASNYFIFLHFVAIVRNLISLINERQIFFLV